MIVDNFSARQKFLMLVLLAFVAGIRFYYGLCISDRLVIGNLKDIIFMKNATSGREVQEEMVFVTVSCGSDRDADAINLIKSAVMFSSAAHRLRFIVVGDEESPSRLNGTLTGFQNRFQHFSFSFVSDSFPDPTWRLLFRPCAAQRLFLPSLLPLEEKVIYLDSDVLFTSPPHHIWDHFSNFNATQLASLTTEISANHSDGHYAKLAKHPHYGISGLNSGVFMMHLKKMREVEWEQKMIPIYEEYKSKIVYADQDILNIYFYFAPQQMYYLSCEFNFRTDQCFGKGEYCPAREGIQLIHGNRRVFYGYYQNWIFKEMYDIIRDTKIDDNPICFDFKSIVEFGNKNKRETYCTKSYEKFLQIPRQILLQCQS